MRCTGVRQTDGFQWSPTLASKCETRAKAALSFPVPFPSHSRSRLSSAALSNGSLPTALFQFFAEIDQDGSGDLDKSELFHALQVRERETERQRETEIRLREPFERAV